MVCSHPQKEGFWVLIGHMYIQNTLPQKKIEKEAAIKKN
jgi:hypothetical protein